MILYVCSIRDSATVAYTRPVFVVAPGQAMRSFQDECNRVAPDNDLSNHPGDFELHQLGTFDDSTGRFSTIDPVLLMRGKDCVKPKE